MNSRSNMDVRGVVPDAGQLAWRAVEDDRRRGRARAARRSARPRRTRARRRGSSRRARWCRRASSAASASCASTSTPGGRLVEDEQRRLGGERLGDERALLLAAGERRERRVCTRRRARPARSPRRRARGRAARERAEQAAARRRRPAATTSRTVAGASIAELARAAPGSRASRRREKRMRRLAEQARPARGSAARAPATSRRSVVLPPPFGPAIATNSPASMPRSTSSQHRRRRAVGERDAAKLDALAAPERLPERGEVLAHDREVVLAAARAPPSVSPSSGSSTAVAAPVSRATVSASRGETSVSKKTVVAACSRTWPTTRSSSRALGSASGASPVTAICSSPYAARQIAERGVAGDDLVPRAVREPRGASSVEPQQLLPSFAPQPRAGRAPRRSLDDARVPHRIEPHVRIDRRLRRSRRPPRRPCQVEPLEQVERLAVGTVERPFERRLEAGAEVEDEVGASAPARRRGRTARRRAARRPAASGSSRETVFPPTCSAAKARG